MLNNMLLANSPVISLKIELYFCTIERDRRTCFILLDIFSQHKSHHKTFLAVFSFLVKSQLQVEADLERPAISTKES